jgi:hypothetical protein
MKVQHQADIIRMRIMREVGGIYLDADVIPLRDFDELRRHNLSMGLEGDAGLCNAVMVGAPNTSFINRWWAEYAHFDPTTQWAYHSVHLPRGSIRVGTPPAFGIHHLMPVVTGFGERYPDIETTVVLDDGRESRTFHLNRSYYGLYIPPMVWREINNFSSGAVCMALASDFYDEADYYREHDTFIKAGTGR